MKRGLIIVILAAVLLTACGAAGYVTDTRYIRDTCFVSRLQVDSVYRRDSVFVREKGDTVYKYVERWRDRYRLIRDTVYRSRTDSVYVDRLKEVEVEKPLTAWQKFRMDGFWVLFATVAGVVLWKFRKPLSSIFLRL